MVIVFKDIFAHNGSLEVISDSFQPTDVFGKFVFKCASNYIEVKDDCGVANNDDDGGDMDGPQKVLNIVHNFGLSETKYTKAEFMTWAKGYMKKLITKLTTDAPDDVAAFKTEATNYIKFVTENIENITFYINSEMDEEGMVIPALWTNEEKDTEGPTFYYFRPGLKGEKY